MKFLSIIDHHILAFWYTSPEERLWAYLATLPVLLLLIDTIKQIF